MNGRGVFELRMPGECLDSPGIVYISGAAMYPVLKKRPWKSCESIWKRAKYSNFRKTAHM